MSTAEMPGAAPSLGPPRPRTDQAADGAGHELNHDDMSDFDACVGGGPWAANTRITTPGVYTITVDAEQVRGRATLHATQQVTVLAP